MEGTGRTHQTNNVIQQPRLAHHHPNAQTHVVGIYDVNVKVVWTDNLNRISKEMERATTSENHNNSADNGQKT